jgi:phosphomethylpyrimidine synthase
MCGPKFCSMRITQDLRADARRQAEQGMEAKAAEFRAGGGSLYVKSER